MALPASNLTNPTSVNKSVPRRLDLVNLALLMLAGVLVILLLLDLNVLQPSASQSGQTSGATNNNSLTTSATSQPTPAQGSNSGDY
ncbi:MAG TPA: hypothetical protein VKQ72_07685 [Aggregatilineales bacterium]|nr:hypothetical protein [Aggregatilineales bacterium]